MGSLQFGSETFHANANVTFEIMNWGSEIGVKKNTNASESTGNGNPERAGWLSILSILAILLLRII
jgi:hypothetical protein